MDAAGHSLSERTFAHVSIHSLKTPKAPPRYFDKDLRKVVYDGGDYWSSPVRPGYQLGQASVRPGGRRQQAYADHKRMFRDVDSFKLEPEVKKESRRPDNHIDILSLLDHRVLGKIKRDFHRHKHPLSLEEFVDVMTQYLPVKQIGEVKLAVNLCKFFSDVDVNGDGSMEWDEFTSFIIDKGMNLVDSSSAESIEAYQKSTLQDKNTHNSRIERIEYMAERDHVVVMEKGMSSFKVLGGKDCTQVANVKGHSAEIVTSEFISGHNWVATSSNDRTIRFWNPDQNYSPVNFKISTALTQMALRWNSHYKLLFSSDVGHDIHAWEFHKHEDKFHEQYTANPVFDFKGHTDVVLDLLVLQSMGTLASACLDKTIGLWDISTQKCHHQLEGHEKGVFQLAYHQEYHALVSASFEHSAIVWNPYCQLKICKLKGHYNPLIGVAAVPDSPQILTADGGGIIKIWDIRTYGCVQTLYVEDQRGVRVSDVSTFASMPMHKRLACGSTRLHFYDSLTSSSHHNPAIADLQPCIRAFHNSNDASFITASGNTVKIWSEADGSLARVYRNIIPNEITALCLDDAQKKFIIGDTQGNLKVFNYLNGALMKAVRNAASREITGVEYVPGLKQIILTAWDGTIYLYDETDNEGIPLIKRMSKHKDEITCAAFSENLNLFATGSADGQVYIWDYQSHVQVGELGGHKTDITALVFLDPYPIVVSADNQGNICFWVVRPVVLRVGKCILRMMNQAKGKRGGSAEHLPVPALAFWETGGEARLYGADVSGVIKVWNIKKALERWNFAPFGERGKDHPNNLQVDAAKDQRHTHDAVPTRYASYIEYRKNHRHVVARLESAAKSRKNVLQPGDVKLVKWWQAHTESIRDLRLISDPPTVGIALLSCSFDKKACLWDIHGNNIGNLQQGNTKEARRMRTYPKTPEWVFCSDMEGRQRATQDNAHRVLEQLAKMHKDEQHKKREKEKHKMAVRRADREDRSRGNDHNGPNKGHEHSSTKGHEHGAKGLDRKNSVDTGAGVKGAPDDSLNVFMTEASIS